MTTNDPDKIRADIEATRAALSEDVDNLEEKVSPSKIAQRQTDRVRSAVTGVKDKVFGTATDAGDNVHDMSNRAADAAKGVPGDVRRTTQGNPLAAGLVAFGAGLLVAALLPATRTEKRAVHAAKEDEGVQHAADELKSAAQDIGSSLQEPATEAFTSVKETAMEGAQQVKETAAAGAKDVTSEARDATDQVRSQAQHGQDSPTDQRPRDAGPDRAF